MTTPIDVDVAILGAGSGGLYAMGQVRKAGKSFVLCDGGPLGTTCARVGCMPSKAAIHVAESFHHRHHFAELGLAGAAAIQVDRRAAWARVRAIRDQLVGRVIGNSTGAMPTPPFIPHHARFTGPNTLIAGETEVRFAKAIIGTGSKPIVPGPWRALGERVLTTDELFELDEPPARLAVIGLGVIGLELGQALVRLGCEVVGVDALTRIGGLTDPIINERAIARFAAEFPLWLGQGADLEATPDGIRVKAGEHEAEVDAVLVAIGRRPALAGLGLEALGLELDARGMPSVNPHTMQVGDSHVFLAGDVTGDRAILHEAGDEGRIAGYNASRDAVTAFRRKTPLGVVFCDPNLATVGAAFDRLDPETTAVGEFDLTPHGRALVMQANHGLIRIYADKASGRLLGATLFCARAEHLAHLLAFAIERGETVLDLLKRPFYHPVFEEALQSALYATVKQLDPAAQPQGPWPLELDPIEAEAAAS